MGAALTQILWWSGLLKHKYCGDQGCLNTNTVVIRAALTQILWWSGLLEHKYCGDQGFCNTNFIVIRAPGTQILWWLGLLEHKYCGEQGCWNTNTVVYRAAGTQILWWSGLLEHKYYGEQGCSSNCSFRSVLPNTFAVSDSFLTPSRVVQKWLPGQEYWPVVSSHYFGPRYSGDVPLLRLLLAVPSRRGPDSSPRTVHVGFLLEKLAFMRVLRICPVSIISPMLHTHPFFYYRHYIILTTGNAIK